MMTFKYFVIRYQPDKVTNEFVNIGIIAYLPEKKVLKCKIKEDLVRVSDFFYGLNIHDLENSINLLKSKIRDIDKQLTSGNIGDVFDFEKALNEIFLDSDSSLQIGFSNIALTSHFERSVIEFYKSIVTKYDFCGNEIRELYQNQRTTQNCKIVFVILKDTIQESGSRRSSNDSVDVYLSKHMGWNKVIS